MSTSRHTRRRGMAAALALAAVLAVSGCDLSTPTLNLNWQPPTWPQSEVALIDALPSPVVDTSSLQLIDHRLRNADARVQGRFSYLPGAENEAFNHALDALVQDGLAQASAHSGVSYAPQKSASTDMAERGCITGATTRPAADVLADPLQGSGGDGTAIVCDVVVASGTVFGERIRTVIGDGAGSVLSDTASVVYTDTATNETASAHDLWTSEAIDGLFTEIVNAIRRENGALSFADAHPATPEAREAFARALDSTVPSGNGGLAFTIPAGFTTPELDGLGIPALPEAQHIEVPAGLLSTLATPLGQSVAAASGQAFTNPELGYAGNDWVNCEIVACVAVTYDDGPHGYYTPQLLDTASSMRVPLTFYVLGSMAEANPEVLLRAHNEGHNIANHSWSHEELTTVSDDTIISQLVSTSDLVENITGSRPTTFRPPYGAVNDHVLSLVSIPAINWSVDTNDWQKPGPAELVARGIDPTEAGGIVLYHDIHPDSIAVAADVFSGLRDHGFTLVTIPQLFGGNLPTEGVWSSITRRWGE